MKIESLLTELFPDGHSVTINYGLLSGTGKTDQGEVSVIGTSEGLAIDSGHALQLSCYVLSVVRDNPGMPILLLVDTQGQRLSKTEELFGLNGYLAHLVKCLDLARRKGHRLISLVYADAVSGGFLSFGLLGDEIHALPDARISVMNLPAMSKITKLPLEMLEELSVSSPWFAPGVENFYKLGGVHSVWSQPYSVQLSSALKRSHSGDNRRSEGLLREGRKLAGLVSQEVVQASCLSDCRA
jgi:malonate decarboxylase gamma subunit